MSARRRGAPECAFLAGSLSKAAPHSRGVASSSTVHSHRTRSRRFHRTRSLAPSVTLRLPSRVKAANLSRTLPPPPNPPARRCVRRHAPREQSKVRCSGSSGAGDSRRCSQRTSALVSTPASHSRAERTFETHSHGWPPFVSSVTHEHCASWRASATQRGGGKCLSGASRCATVVEEVSAGGCGCWTMEGRVRRGAEVGQGAGERRRVELFQDCSPASMPWLSAGVRWSWKRVSVREEDERREHLGNRMSV